MANIKPFRAVRPKSGFESKIAALPYDVYNRQEAKQKIQGDSYSFLRIDRAETTLDDSVDTYDARVYKQARYLYDDMKTNGLYVKEDTSCYYLYELTMNEHSQTGIVAVASVFDYENGTIMKHENTRVDKELDRINHVDAMDAQTGPIFLAYRKNQILEEIKNQIKISAPSFDFYSDDNIRHRGWMIDDLALIDQIQSEFLQMNEIYIADGHHRCASAVKVSKRRREQFPADSMQEYDYFLAVLFSDDELTIFDYNRVVKDLNGYSIDEFISLIRKDFDVILANEKDLQADGTYRPLVKGNFGMFLDGQWYHLKAHDDIMSDDPVLGLDVSILQDYLLNPILNIMDPKQDSRIDFVGGIRGLKELERRCETDCKVAFSMYPTSMDELFCVADAKKLMPPKSTWFEPKLRSGLFIHELETQKCNE